MGITNNQCAYAPMHLVCAAYAWPRLVSRRERGAQGPGGNAADKAIKQH
jgi:hypothetical protein